MCYMDELSGKAIHKRLHILSLHLYEISRKEKAIETKQSSGA